MFSSKLAPAGLLQPLTSMHGDRRALTVWHQDVPWIDPFLAAGAFDDLPVLALLDSTGPIHDFARYSYLCVDPYHVIRVEAGQSDGSLDLLRSALAEWTLVPDLKGMPFRGGLAGFIGYEVGGAIEHVPQGEPAADDPPDLFIGAYDLTIGFDRTNRSCRIHATGLPAADNQARRNRAMARIAWASERIARLVRPAPPPPPLAWVPDWTEAEYRTRLDRLLGYIRSGDIYQANLTMRHQAKRPENLGGWAMLGALRHNNPAPFSAWLRCGEHELICSSPERFLRLGAGREIETRPIKGTAARSGRPETDALVVAALATSAKDRAENVMIVDVLRNDLGRVADIGSLAVPALCQPETFATLHHLVSTITARLAAGRDALDLLAASLPGGSITGAPKIRAMQIIAELETSRRGPYCGCVVLIGFDGAMDSNIIIRSLVLTPERVIAQAGGGIVADSDPASEYREMMLKSRAVRETSGHR